ncbi:MAG: ANTAR domain-containing protein [Pseudomonadota bacterium]
MAHFQLKSLRDLFVVVAHPPDPDSQLVMQQLERIGCRTEAAWPIPRDLPQATDVLVAAIGHDHHKVLKSTLRRAGARRPDVIALADYENPAMLELMLDLDALAVISKPVRPFGILTNVVVARNVSLTSKALVSRVRRLELRMEGQKKIAKAKAILMETQAISEEDAYKIIRAQAMTKRISIEEMADAVIYAHDLLSGRTNAP